MKFLGKVIFIVLITSLSAGSAEVAASRLAWSGCLKTQSEISICINEGNYWQIWSDDILYQDGNKNIELLYEAYGNEHGIDVATLRGDNFYPHAFWQQPSQTIFKFLFPILKKNRVFDIVNCKDEIISCFQTQNPGYDFKDGLSKEFPDIVEYSLELDVFAKIEIWTKENMKETIDWQKYQESLHNYYGAKEPLKANDPNARKLPLYEYFLPYLSR